MAHHIILGWSWLTANPARLRAIQAAVAMSLLVAAIVMPTGVVFAEHASGGG